MDVPSYLLGKNAGGGGGGGTTYTAGTNIEITNENVINNTIPFEGTSGNGFVVGRKKTNTTINTSAIGIGKNITASGLQTVVIGNNATGSNQMNVAIGEYATADSSHGIAIGREAGTHGNSSIVIGVGSVTHQSSSIVLGRDANARQSNLFQIGSSSYPINKAQITTSNGDKELATQDYVDNKAIQTSTMETASSDNLGKIVQYTGTTDSNYTNGYFYKCVSDGASTPTYSWEELEVQASGGSTDTKVYYINDNSENNPFIFDENELGIYFFSDDNIVGYDDTKRIIYVKGTSSQTVTTFLIDRTGYLKITKKYSQASNLETFAVTNPGYSIDYGKLLVTIPTFIKMNDSIAGSSITQSSSWGVDTSSIFTSLDGYDGSKTQVLKNINGTLTWVDE